MGFPGSGKSTYAKTIDGYNEIVSSDKYFTDANGNYNWTVQDAHKGHEDCLRKYIDAVYCGKYDKIIVDNTNVNIVDVSVYIRIAQAFGYTIEVLFMNTDIKLAKLRNIHGVPDSAYDKMKDNLDNLLRCWPRDFPEIQFIKA